MPARDEGDTSQSPSLSRLGPTYLRDVLQLSKRVMIERCRVIRTTSTLLSAPLWKGICRNWSSTIWASRDGVGVNTNVTEKASNGLLYSDKGDAPTSQTPIWPNHHIYECGLDHKQLLEGSRQLTGRRLVHNNLVFRDHPVRVYVYPQRGSARKRLLYVTENRLTEISAYELLPIC